MRQVHVTPTEGLDVIDPKTGKKLPKTGTTVDRTPWWIRRERHGEVIFSEPQTQRRRAPTKTEEKPR